MNLIICAFCCQPSCRAGVFWCAVICGTACWVGCCSSSSLELLASLSVRQNTVCSLIKVECNCHFPAPRWNYMTPPVLQGFSDLSRESVHKTIKSAYLHYSSSCQGARKLVAFNYIISKHAVYKTQHLCCGKQQRI
jgi:hypothetical protein